MTNPTPRDSAQLPPLPAHDALAQVLFLAWQATPCSELDGEYTLRWLDLSPDYKNAWRSVAREALRAQAASVEPVGSVDHVEWSASKEQWRHNIWADKKIPFGTRLYAGAPPAHIPAVEAHRNFVLQAQALIDLDAEGALVPHGIGGHARTLLKSAIRLLSKDWHDKAKSMGFEGVADALCALQASRQPHAQQAAAEGAGDDAKRLDWLEVQAKESRTGVSIDYARYVEDGLVLERGYRVMRRHDIGERFITVRQAIDAAIATKEQRS